MLEPRSSNGRQVLSPVREDVVAPHWLCYAYDKAGNMLKKQILRSGRARSPSAPQSDDYVTTTFTFDAANQLVSSTTDGVTTRYAYDAAGRLVKEGSKTYRYGYLDKVMSVTDGDTTRTYTYHADGQLASATVGGEHRAPRDRVGPPGGRPLPESETFLWDGLALVKRGGESFVNEPHVGGGNPVASSKGTTYFNDALGTTVGAKKDGKYSAAALTAFGEDLSVNSSGESSRSPFPVPHSPFPIPHSSLENRSSKASATPSSCATTAPPRKVADRRSPWLSRRLEFAGVLQQRCDERGGFLGMCKFEFV